MQRKIQLCLMLLVFSFSYGLRAAYAQEEDKPAPEESKPKAEHRSDSGQPGAAMEKQMRPYRADFTVTELDDGKRINARHYSMLLNVGGWNQIKIGTRVPVSNGVSVFQYMDVGTSINCRLIESGDDLGIDVHSDFSSLSTPEDEHSRQPTVRQVSLSGNTLVTNGKPVVIGTVDDPTSKRQFQLEATVTKLK